MNTAADQDKDSLSKGTTAIAKLLAKEKVEKFLNCGKYHETFLNMNGCILLNKWLEKHTDGTFPCNPVKEMILRSIRELPITIENLQESGLGKSVNAIAASPGTTTEIKKLANELKEKWMRMIYGRTTDYSQLETFERHAGRARRDKPIAPKRTAAEIEATAWTKVPECNNFDYTFRPIPRTN